MTPCNTNGTETNFLISDNLSKSILGSPLYKPCAVPMAIANEDTPVLSTNSFAPYEDLYEHFLLHHLD